MSLAHARVVGCEERDNAAAASAVVTASSATASQSGLRRSQGSPSVKAEGEEDVATARMSGTDKVRHLVDNLTSSPVVQLGPGRVGGLGGLTDSIGVAIHEVKTAQKQRRQEQLQRIEATLTHGVACQQSTAVRSRSCCQALSALVELQPSLGPVLRSVSNYLRELSGRVERADAAQAEALARHEKELYSRYETFFEGKMRELLQERAKVEASAAALQDELNTLRRDRDEELMRVKAELMQRLTDYERREQDFQYYRQLIASVYKTNEQLTRHNEDLEDVLRRHHLDIPPAPVDLFVYSGRRGQGRATGQSSVMRGNAISSQTGGNHDSGELMAVMDTRPQMTASVAEVDNHGVRLLSQQVPIAFIAASQQEMQHARLTLQEELLHCAFDERSAYRLQVNGLKQENANLKFEVKRQEERIIELTRYIHEKRFLHPLTEDDATLTAGGADAQGQMRAGNAGGMVVSNRALTPRPRDIPFSVQTELGIDLMNSTAKIVAELAAVSTNLKQQLHSTLLRVRQLSMVNEWMSEETLLALDAVRNEVGVLNTFAVEEWPSIPHFLRTRVGPTVSNLRWSEVATGAILLEFFRRYDELRENCRQMHATATVANATPRDDKMLAPRSHQLYERRALLLTPLDATPESMRSDADLVPFGYVVSQFVKEYLLHVTPAAVKTLQVVLPATRSPYFVNEGERQVVELEFARFSYSLWWAVQRYSRTQPLCRLFLDIVHGRLPVAVFHRMEQVLQVVRDLVNRLDTDGSGSFTYHKLLHGTLKLVADLDAPTAHSGTLAVAQTFESNEIAFVGGRIRRPALLADESHCVAEGAASSDASSESGAGGVVQSANNVMHSGQGAIPPRITVRYVPPRSHQPLGASVYMRYWRRVVLERYVRIYNFLEHLLVPLVRESEMVLGLYLLPVAEATARLRLLDHVPERKGQAFVDDVFYNFPFVGAGGGGGEGGSSSSGGGGGNANASSGNAMGLSRPRSTESIAEELRSEVPNTLGVISNLPPLRVPDVTRQYLSLLEERRDQQYATQATRYVMLEHIFHAAMQELPRLSYRIHFPFHPEQVDNTQPLSHAEGSVTIVNVDEGGNEVGGRRSARGRNATRRSLLQLSTTSRSEVRLPATLRGTSEAGTTSAEDGASTNGGEAKSRRSRRGNGSATRRRSSWEVNSPLTRPSSAASAGSASTRRSGRRKKGAHAAKKHLVPSSAASNAGATENKEYAERELVEWYGFCAQLRQQLPDFSELLFQSAEHVSTIAPLSLSSHVTNGSSSALELNSHETSQPN